jgi:CheY-like chemotaxis protein
MVSREAPVVKKVLLVDDNDTDNFINKRIIELTKFAEEITVKNSGKSALEYLGEHQEDPDALPDLIFLDINMPIVDGFIFLYEFESFSNVIKEKCKVVVLSSSNSSRDRNQIMANDVVVKFLTKPLTPDALNEVESSLN